MKEQRNGRGSRGERERKSGKRKRNGDGARKTGKPAEKVVVAAATAVVVVARLVGVVGRENRRWVDRCMNIHDLTTNPYTATGLCLHYCISNSADGSQNSLFAAVG